MPYEKAGVETFQNLSSTERWQTSLATIRNPSPILDHDNQLPIFHAWKFITFVVQRTLTKPVSYNAKSLHVSISIIQPGQATLF